MALVNGEYKDVSVVPQGNEPGRLKNGTANYAGGTLSCATFSATDLPTLGATYRITATRVGTGDRIDVLATCLTSSTVSAFEERTKQ